MRPSGQVVAAMTAVRSILLITTLVLGLAQPAFGDEVAYCWYEASGGIGKSQVLRCRIAGSDSVVLYERIEPPPTLWPAVGDDGNGECWYNRTIFTGWRIVGSDGDDNAYMWYSPDDLFAGPWIDVGWIRRCDSEPIELTTIIDLLWDAIASFEFAEPDAVLQPDAGVTGLPTYLDLDPPDPTVVTLASPVTGRVVEVEFVVAAVEVDWGDGEIETITPSLYELFGPYPDGGITHTYETKDDYSASVAYQWRVQWRFDGGPWQAVNDIEPTTWSASYQVDEIVTRVTG